MNEQEQFPDARIKTVADMERLIAFERGKFVIQMQNEFLTFRNSPIFSKQEADHNYFHLVKSLQTVLKNPADLAEQEDAQKSLESVRIEPFRVH